MSTQQQPFLTPSEYLAFERSAKQRHEYCQGEIFAMDGASSRHNQIVANTLISLGTQLKKRACRVWTNDMRVKVDASGLYAYPDLLAFCGEAKFDDEHSDTLLNPQVIVEVLSKSTEAYDRGDKFAHYRQIESLQEYILISQDKPRLERYTRQADDKWLLEEIADPASAIHLQAIDCELRLAEVYDNVDF